MATPHQGSPPDDAILKKMLVQWLRANGYRKLCKREERNYEKKSEAISVNIVSSVLLGLVIFAFYRLNWSLWASVGAVTAALMVTVILHMTLKMPAKLGTYTFLYLWIGIGVWLLWGGDTRTLFLSHALPFMIVVGGRISFRALLLSFRVPLFVPVALIIVLLPLLTEDPWRLATAAGSQLAWLAGVSIIPLAVLLVVKLVRIQILPVFQLAAEKIDNDANRSEEAFKLIKEYESNKNGKLDSEAVKSRLDNCYTSISPENANRAVEAASRAFRWQAVRRLMSLIAGVLLAVWVLIYILAWAAVPRSLAADWAQGVVSIASLDVVGIQIALPAGPYILVATMLAIVACVGFLGFALTDDQHSAALWDALVNAPAQAYLLIAIPYVDLSTDSRGRDSVAS
jgi:VIT1/CCC1 family predicted Fe2+/Mn2+ transporter